MKTLFTSAKTGVCLSAFLSISVSSGESVAGSVDTAPMSDKPVSAAPWQRYDDWPDKSWDKFNTLAAVVNDKVGTLPEVTYPITGDAAKGKELAFDRKRGGSCAACHIMGSETPELPGNVGPDLSTIGNGERTDQHLFTYIYEPRLINPASVMPPWGSHALFTVEEIKDIVAFLKTLNKPMVFANEHDNPAKRQTPVESRDNLDPIENPAMAAMEQGEALFKSKGANGKSCISCHTKPKNRFKKWAAGMPTYSNKLKKVIGVEEFVARHAMATTGDNYLMQSEQNISLSIYLRYLANGTPIAVKAEGKEAGAAAARGEDLSKRKIGQLNFACVDCHQLAANHWIRGQWLGGSKGQTPHFPTWRTSKSEIWDIRKRFQWCNVAIRANELAPDAAEYGDIELYLTMQNNGLKLNVPGIRH
ncbi:MAG: sulfur oxidation c-type cytochrome SoxA [Gammaproteobacteria bacterium]|nr:sulfur oxidation c-type cytochrome SoxA [Gammaproteobacteria bacterium]